MLTKILNISCQSLNTDEAGQQDATTNQCDVIEVHKVSSTSEVSCITKARKDVTTSISSPATNDYTAKSRSESPSLIFSVEESSKPITETKNSRCNEIKILKSETKDDAKMESRNTIKTQMHGILEIDPLFCDPRRPEAKVFACKCKKTYFSSSALNSHIKSMKFGNAYACILCSQEFPEFLKLKLHVNNFHCKPFEVFLCAFCRQEYKSQGIFRKHLLEFHDEQ